MPSHSRSIPQETFSLTLELDAADALEHPDAHPVAALAGVADRIAAIEMLCYPPGQSALGGLLNVSVSVSVGSSGLSASIGAGAKADVLPRNAVPIILFFWGPGRIVPVRITTFSVEEQQYSPLLYPIRAKATLGLKVLDENQLVNVEGGGGRRLGRRYRQGLLHVHARSEKSARHGQRGQQRGIHHRHAAYVRRTIIYVRRQEPLRKS